MDILIGIDFRFNGARRVKKVFCRNCGARIDDGSAFCAGCGASQGSGAGATEPVAPAVKTATNDAKSGGFAFLCCIEPLIGLILYLVWKDTMPLKASSCGKGAIIGVILYIAVPIVLVVGFYLFMLFIALVGNSYALAPMMLAL